MNLHQSRNNKSQCLEEPNKTSHLLGVWNITALL